MPAMQILKRKIKAYIPDFKLAFEHVCIHTGGRGVVEEIEKQLSMTPKLMQPSKDTLYRYGNTSSSSIWCAPALSAPAFLLAFCFAGRRLRSKYKPISRASTGLPAPPATALA